MLRENKYQFESNISDKNVVKKLVKWK